MSDRTRMVFEEIVKKVVEGFAFMFADADDEISARCQPDGGYAFATMTFKGAGEGVVNIAAPQSLCLDLAANVLGVEKDEATPADGDDALKELLNVICGNLTVALFGQERAFDLTIPTLYRIDTWKWNEMWTDNGNKRFSIDGKPMVANLIVSDAEEDPLS